MMNILHVTEKQRDNAGISSRTRWLSQIDNRIPEVLLRTELEDGGNGHVQIMLVVTI
jgi:hypothetical protein